MPVIKKKVMKKSMKTIERGKPKKISVSLKMRAIKAIMGEDKAEALRTDKTSLKEIYLKEI
jgi:hypothetical protein